MNRQTILLAIVVLILAVTAYLWYRRGAAPPPGEGVAGDAITHARIGTLRRLKNIRPDTDFLKEESFQALQAFSPPPYPQYPPGRENPFLVPTEKGIATPAPALKPTPSPQ